VRELWEALFQTTVQRFFHFAEREQLEQARREYAYLEQLVHRMERRWPVSEQRNSLVVQTLAIIELYLLRGQVEKARETAHGVFESTRDPRLLQALFRMEFWIGNYAKAVEIMKKMEELAQNSVQNQYLYLRQPAITRGVEQSGEPEACQPLRQQACSFSQMFDFVTDPDLKTEQVLYMRVVFRRRAERDRPAVVQAI
jgi:tetratricopeptide (TPR) repeat protein